MSTSTTAFGLDTVHQVGAAAIRVRFTLAPKLVRASNAVDGLNPANYSPRGPVDNRVVEVSPVDVDHNAVDVRFASALAAGTWVLAVQNTQTPSGQTLNGITLLAFTATSPFTESVAAGFTNDAAKDVLRKNFNPAIVGPNIDAVLASIAAGDQTNWDNAKLVFDQLFKSSASGKYLDQRAGDSGVERPQGIGMGDDLFRQLAILVSSERLTYDALWRALEIYFGTDTVRAYTTALAEPYVLVDGDTLMLAGVTVTFKSADFASIGAATAVEVAAAINRACELVASRTRATSFTDPSTALNYVRIYADKLGLGAKVSILGGRAQSVLQFPTVIRTGSVTTQWTVGPSPTSVGSLRFTFSSGPDPALDTVFIGDYVNAFGPFAAVHKGTYQITALKVDGSTSPRTIWFEVPNTSSLMQATTIAAATDLVFFRPSFGQQPSASVSQHGEQNTLDVVLPATTQSVNRGVDTGAYLHLSTTLSIPVDDSIGPLSPFLMPTSGILNPVVYVARDGRGVVTVTTDLAHGLSVGDQIFVEELYAASNTGLDPNSWTQFGTSMRESRQQHTTTVLSDGRILVTGGVNQNSAVVNTVEILDPVAGTWTQGANMATARFDHRATLMQDGRVLITGGNSVVGGTSANYLRSVEVYDPIANSWNSVPDMPDAVRAGHITSLLGNSAILVTGGNQSVSTYAIYQPWTNSWTSASMGAITIGEFAATVVLANGNVLVSGGLSGASGVTGAWIFTPGTLTWAATGSLSTGRYRHRLIALLTGKFLAIGGTTNGTAGLTSCELYDSGLATWSAAASIKNARYAHQALILTSGQVLAFGGIHNGTILSTVEIYDAVGNSWAASTDTNPTIGPMTEARAHFGSAYVNANNKVVSIGGQTTVGKLADFERYPREIGGGGLNGMQTVSFVLTPTQFQYQTPDFPFVSVSNSGIIIPLRAPPSGNVVGPYIYDPHSGVAITGTQTTSSVAIGSGSHISTLAVADASQFPDQPGYLVFGFGTSKQQGPVPYLGRLSPTALLINQSYLFTQDLAVSENVCLLSQKGPWVPDEPEDVGSFYLTASPAGRTAAIKTLTEMIGTGIETDFTTLYPGDQGLGGEGFPASGSAKLSDKVAVWAGDDVDTELANARAS